MATTTASMTTTITDKTDVWHLTVANTSAQSYSATLNTAGKYLDRDITINYSTVTGSMKAEMMKGTSVVTTTQSFTPTIANCSATVTGKTRIAVAPVTNTASISTDYFIALRTNTNTVTFSAKATVTSSGYLAKDTNVTSDSFNFITKASSITYVPIASATINTSVDTGKLSDYFNITTSNSYTVAITPKYTNTAGYTGEVTTAKNNGGTTYWTIKTSTPTVTDSTGLATLQAANSGYTSATKVVPSGGALVLPSGWYTNTYITLADLIPEIDSNDAANGNILKGYKAYDEQGNVLTGTIETRTPSTTYYTSDNTGLGKIEGPGYIASTTYIKRGALNYASISAGSAFKPTISVVSTQGTNAGTNIVSVQNTITSSTTEPTSGYYVAVNTNSSTITVTASSKVLTSGWIDSSSTSTGTTTVATINAADTTYFSIDAGGVSASGGALTTVTATNVIDTSNVSAGVADATYTGTKYAITASSNVTFNNQQITLTKTAGYIEGGTVTGIAAGTINKTETPSATINLKKAVLGSEGTVSTAPAVTATQTPTGIVTSSTSTAYYVQTTFGSTDGTVQTKYKATGAGYTPTVAATNGGKVTVTPSKPSTQTTYIQAAVVSAKTSLTNIDTYFTAATGSGNITVTTNKNVTKEGYTKTTDTTVTTSYYNIKTTTVSTNHSTLDITKKSGDLAFESQAQIYDSTAISTTKTYVSITSTATITAHGTTSATPTITQSGWITSADLKGTGTFSADSAALTVTNTAYIELYMGEYTYA